MAFDDSQKWVSFFGNAIYFAPRRATKASTATTSFPDDEAFPAL